MIKLIVQFVACVAAMISPFSVSAAWYQASSPHFLIYGDNDSTALRTYAEKLERFDQAVRFVRGLPEFVPAPVNRLTIYQVKDLDAVQTLYGGGGVGGFYLARASGSIAFVPRDAGAQYRTDLTPDVIFFHEYAHHLMYQRLNAAYPPWLVEGFAEFFSTATVESDGSVAIGKPALHRAELLTGNYTPLPAQVMLAPRRGKMQPLQFAQMYGRGWLLLHYLTFNPQRRGQLDRYIAGIQSGTPAIEAARTAFGSLSRLDNELNSYMRSTHFDYVVVPAAKLHSTAIEVTPLRPGVAAMMPVIMQSKRGVDKKSAPRVAEQARRVAAGFGNDPEVQRALAEAEHDAHNEQAAILAADRSIALDPKLGDAMLTKARSMMRLAAEVGTASARPPAVIDWKPIRAQILMANRLDPDDPEPLMLYSSTFRKAGEPATPSANQGLVYAFETAPQDMGLRWRAAGALLAMGKDAEARVALVPIAYNPHGSDTRDKAFDVLDKLQRGDRPGAMALLAGNLSTPTKGDHKTKEEHDDGGNDD